MFIEYIWSLLFRDKTQLQFIFVLRMLIINSHKKIFDYKNDEIYESLI